MARQFKVGRADVVGDLTFRARITPLTESQREELVERVKDVEGVRLVFHHSGESSPRNDMFEIVIEPGTENWAIITRDQVADVVYDFQEEVVTQPSPR